MTLVIELRGLELHDRHGVLDHERRDGQRFLVDVELEPTAQTAETTDRIEDAVDYRDVVDVVQAVSAGRAYNLLEALAADVADELVRRLPVRRVRVRVCKPDVSLAVPVEHAAVVVVRDVSAR